MGHVKSALAGDSMRVRGPQKRHVEWDKYSNGRQCGRVTSVEIESHQATNDNADNILKKRRLGFAINQVGTSRHKFDSFSKALLSLGSTIRKWFIP
jgi:hypothetical protein